MAEWRREYLYYTLAKGHYGAGGLDFESLGYPDFEQGLLGLVRLGAAWQSPDIFYFLQSYYLFQELEHPRLLANLRVAELLADNQRFLSPEIEPSFQDPADAEKESRLVPELVNSTLLFYEQARLATEQRDQSLASYVETNIKEDRHPDTTIGFWRKWQEPEFPSLPKTTLAQRFPPERVMNYLLFILGLLVLLAVDCDDSSQALSEKSSLKASSLTEQASRC